MRMLASASKKAKVIKMKRLALIVGCLALLNVVHATKVPQATYVSCSTFVAEAARNGAEDPWKLTMDAYQRIVAGKPVKLVLGYAKRYEGDDAILFTRLNHPGEGIEVATTDNIGQLEVTVTTLAGLDRLYVALATNTRYVSVSSFYSEEEGQFTSDPAYALNPEVKKALDSYGPASAPITLRISLFSRTQGFGEIDAAVEALRRMWGEEYKRRSFVDPHGDGFGMGEYTVFVLINNERLATKVQSVIARASAWKPEGYPEKPFVQSVGIDLGHSWDNFTPTGRN
jgi:hypothetical protein